MMSDIYNDKNLTSSTIAASKQNGNDHNAELVQRLTELQQAYEDIRNARRAALNLMEDALLSKEALQKSEEKYRTKLEQDVRDRTAELNESKELLQATIDSSLDIIQVFKALRDKEGKIVDFIWIMNNKRGIEQNGDVIGKKLLPKHPGVVKTGIFNKMVQVVETGVPLEHEQYYNYEQFEGWFYQALVKSGDGVVMTTRDITEQKKVQEKIKELNKELFSKNRELETANSELQTFSSVAASDYKETLKHLYTLFEFIVTNDARNLSNAGKANIRRAQAAIQKMKLLTDDILEYAEIQTAASEIKTVSLDEIFEVVLQKLNKKIEDSNATIKLAKGMQKIQGYPNLLSLLFYHLLDNAIKFRKPDTSPVIEIRYSNIEGANIKHADAEVAIHYFVVSITDNGIGIESLEKEKLFTMFYKGHDKTKYKGSGIGLAICKKIMDLQNGLIIAEPSVETGGTTVNCFFPLENSHS